MFSSDEKEVRLAELKRDVRVKELSDLVERCDRWVTSAPHFRGCKANEAHIASACTCGRTALLLALMDRRKNAAVHEAANG